MNWILESVFYWIFEVVQSLLGMLVGVYESINIDIGYDINDTSPDTLFTYTFFSDDTQLKGTFDGIFSQAHIFMQVFTYMAFLIVVTVYIFKIYQAMIKPDGRDVENPLKLTGKFVISIFLVNWSYSIFIYAEKIAQTVYEKVNLVYLDAAGTAQASFLSNLASIATGTQLFRIDSVFDALLNATLGATGGTGLIMIIISCGFFFTMIWQYCRLLLEIIERYVLLGLMFYTCPLAFATNASDSTKHIFKSWIQMLVTQFLIMMMNLFFIGIFIAALDNVYSMEGRDYVFESVGDFVMKNFMLIAWLIVGQRLDQHLNSLGFSVAQAGSGIASALVTTAGAAMATAKAMGKAFKAAGNLGKAFHDAASGNNPGATASNGTGTQGTEISKPGTAQNAAKVENLNGRDPNTGKLSKEGVKEAMDNGATLTGDDAKRAAELLNMPQARGAQADNIDWKNSEINRDGATFMSKANPGAVESHVGFGNGWEARDESGNALAQMSVPTAKGFDDGTRVMTDTDLNKANAQVLDQLTNPQSGTPSCNWTTPNGNPITDSDGNYTKEALNSSHFIGTDAKDPSQQYVAGLNNVNTFDLERGANISTRKTAAYGDIPSFEYGVQHITPGQDPQVASSKSVLRTDANSTNTQNDFVLKRKERTVAESEPQPSLARQTLQNYRNRTRRR